MQPSAPDLDEGYAWTCRLCGAPIEGEADPPPNGDAQDIVCYACSAQRDGNEHYERWAVTPDNDDLPRDEP